MNLDQNYSNWITLSGYTIEVFLENVKRDHLVLSSNNSTKYIYSESIDFNNYSEQDVEKFMKENVFPYYKETSNESFTLVKSAESFESKNCVADYFKGKITIRAKQRAQYMEEVRKEYNDYVNQLKKKYGAKYVDDAMNGKLYVGMPLDILCEYELWDAFAANYGYQPFMSGYTWAVYKRNTTLGIYRIQRWNKRKGNQDYFIVWVRNGKITRINND